MKKIIILGAIVMAFAAINTTFAQTDPFTGWNCADPTMEPGFCSKTLSKNETAWDFAGKLFNNSALWQRFEADNPGKTKVSYDTKGNPILTWKEGATVRIRKQDLTGGMPPDNPINPVPVNVTIDNGWSSLFWQIPLALLALALLVIAALYALSKREANRRLRENPLDPEFMGQPMRSAAEFALNVTPSPLAVRQTLTRLERNGSTLTTATGSLERIIKVRLTLPQGMTVPTEFRTGAMGTRPNNNEVYLGVYYDRQGTIVNVVAAFARCENGLLLNRMSQQQVAEFARRAEWSNPRVITESRNIPVFSWQDVLAFLRNMGAQAEQSTNEETQAQPEQAREAQRTYAVQGAPPPPTAPTQATTFPQMQFSADKGLTIVGGTIDLGKGAKLDLTGGGQVSVDREGRMLINEIPLEQLDQTMVSDSNN